MKGEDLTVPAGEGLLNVRVGAIILRGGKVLMATNDSVDYFYSVGGRVRFGETAEEAVQREVWEETGVHMQVERLGFVHQVFFTDWDVYPGKQVHELALFYYMVVPENFVPRCRSVTAKGRQERLEWIDLSTETRIIYPEFFKEELQHPCRTVKSIVTREWEE